MVDSTLLPGWFLLGRAFGAAPDIARRRSVEAGQNAAPPILSH